MNTVKRRIDIGATNHDNGIIEVQAILNDKYHHMEIQITISEKDKLIRKVSAQMIRAASLILRYMKSINSRPLYHAFHYI